jgi:hypothetical protein
MRIKMFEEYGEEYQYYELEKDTYEEERNKFDYVDLTGWEWEKVKSLGLKVVPRSGSVLSILSKKVGDVWTNIFEIVKKDDGWFFCIEVKKTKTLSLSSFNRYITNYTYYKCDQVDGLIEVIKNKGVVNISESSEFFDQSDIDELLDKISLSGITSLTDIEKNKLTLFSEDDREIIQTIEMMGDITAQFKSLRKEIERLRDEGKNPHSLMGEWLGLNDQMRPLEQSFRKWGIDIGDPRLGRMMSKIRPDVYGTQID